MADFDPVIQKHVRQIKNKETYDHYLSRQIQYELVELLAWEIRRQIIKRTKEAKYFSVMMDYTPDVRKEEQLSIIIRTAHIDHILVVVGFGLQDHPYKQICRHLSLFFATFLYCIFSTTTLTFFSTQPIVNTVYLTVFCQMNFLQ